MNWYKRVSNDIIDSFKYGKGPMKACTTTVEIVVYVVLFIIKRIDITTVTSALISNAIFNSPSLAADLWGLIAAIAGLNMYDLGWNIGDVLLELFG